MPHTLKQPTGFYGDCFPSSTLDIQRLVLKRAPPKVASSGEAEHGSGGINTGPLCSEVGGVARVMAWSNGHVWLVTWSPGYYALPGPPLWEIPHYSRLLRGVSPPTLPTPGSRTAHPTPDARDR